MVIGGTLESLGNKAYKVSISGSQRVVVNYRNIY